MTRFLYTRLPFTKIKVSLSAIIVAGALFYADFSVYTLLVLLSAALHETGHIIAMKICGAEIRSITILPFGAVIDSDAVSLSYGRDAVISLAGAGVNLICALWGWVFFLLINNIYIAFFCICNLFLAVVNLLPIKTLDGGRALEALLYMRVPVYKVQNCIETASFISFAVLAAASFALLSVTGCNLSLTIVFVYLYICVYIKGEDVTA